MRDRSIEEGEGAHEYDPIAHGQVAVEVDLVIGFVSKAVGVLNIRDSVADCVLDQPLDAAAVAASSLSSVVPSGVDLEGLAAGPEGAVGHQGAQDTGVTISDLIIREALTAEQLKEYHLMILSVSESLVWQPSTSQVILLVGQMQSRQQQMQIFLQSLPSMFPAPMTGGANWVNWSWLTFWAPSTELSRIFRSSCLMTMLPQQSLVKLQLAFILLRKNQTIIIPRQPNRSNIEPQPHQQIKGHARTSLQRSKRYVLPLGKVFSLETANQNMHESRSGPSCQSSKNDVA